MRGLSRYRPRCVAAILALSWLAGCSALQGPGVVTTDGRMAVSSLATASSTARPAEEAVPSPEPTPNIQAAAASQTAATEPVVAVSVPSFGTPLRALTGSEDEDPSLRADLWERVRAGFAIPDLDGDLVRRWEAWYASRPDYVQRMTERAGRYLFHIVEEVQRRDMPMELALLPFIESAFNPQALSVARAAGIWQFMPATGRDFELRQNLFRDDRRDVLASTRAALDYLQSLYRMFEDWHLALAAYNWGQGNVLRAQERARRAGGSTDYESLRMPDETRQYVPKLQAVKNIISRPAAFALQLPKLENHPFFLSVPIERDIDVDLAASLAGLPLEEFHMLNPQLNKPVILAAGTPQLLLPYDAANRFVREVARYRGAMATWTAWVAPRTLKPAEAARLTGMTEAALKEVNRIPAGMLLKAGSTIVVARQASKLHDVEEHLAHNAMLSLAPEASNQRARQRKTAASVMPPRHKIQAPQNKARVSAQPRQKTPAPAVRKPPDTKKSRTKG